MSKKQQEHRQWVEGLDIPPEQKQAALLLWDSLLAEVPELQVPPAWVSDGIFESTNTDLCLSWQQGDLPTGGLVQVQVTLEGDVGWCGLWEGKSLGLNQNPSPVLPLPPEAVRVLRTYFSGESKCE